MPKVCVPDDWPPVLAASPAVQKLRERAEVSYFDTLPGSQEHLIERIREALLNIFLTALPDDLYVLVRPEESEGGGGNNRQKLVGRIGVGAAHKQDHEYRNENAVCR